MIRDERPPAEDNFECQWRLFCPPAQPSKEFWEWLWHLTPAGAPVIEVLVSSHAPPHPGCVPRVSARPEAEMPAGIHRLPGRQAPREGKPRWEVESAFRRNIQGWTETQIADNLDLVDHLGPSSTSQEGDRPRSARRYVQAGRLTLAKLGAWPWCLTRDGAVWRDPRWWTTERYLRPLAAWHREAFIDSAMDALGTIEAAAGTHSGSRASEDRWRTADALYREWCSRQAT